MSSRSIAISFVALLLPLACAAQCDTGSCLKERDETSLMQLKMDVDTGTDRSEQEQQEPPKEYKDPKLTKDQKAANEKAREAFKKAVKSDPKDKKPSQVGYKDLEDLRKPHGENAQKHLSELLTKIAKETGLVAHLPPGGAIKSTKRAEEKIKKDYKGNFAKITDICRASLSTDAKDPCGLPKIVAAYNKLKPYVKFTKNKFADPQDNGYSDMNLLVEVPACKEEKGCKQKEICELQVHLLPMMVEKNGFEHEVYEKKQGFERALKDAGCAGDDWQKTCKLKQAEKVQLIMKKKLLDCLGFSIYSRVWNMCFGTPPPVKQCIEAAKKL